MTKRQPHTAEDLDDYQRTVLAGRIARREFEAGFRYSTPQRHAVLLEYLAELNALSSEQRRSRPAKDTLPSTGDYRWQRPVPFRRVR
ncbi:hypothetical protein [Serratia liquefaciens]|uniref:hypothetical protein n=1 Tax=Serratia liquefaciens TaxID=614 RepID=UPI0022B9FFBC|nr:hypothetical protein [Serratia liquefaciens]